MRKNVGYKNRLVECRRDSPGVGAGPCARPAALLALTGLLCSAMFNATAADPDWHKMLSQPTYHGKLRFGVEEIPARDGVIMRAIVYRPDAPGRFPVFLINTPYDKMREPYLEWGQYFAERGYASVIADVRGRYDSDGDNYLYGPTRRARFV